jgi:hypothetical protein
LGPSRARPERKPPDSRPRTSALQRYKARQGTNHDSSDQNLVPNECKNLAPREYISDKNLVPNECKNLARRKYNPLVPYERQNLVPNECKNLAPREYISDKNLVLNECKNLAWRKYNPLVPYERKRNTEGLTTKRDEPMQKDQRSNSPSMKKKKYAPSTHTNDILGKYPTLETLVPSDSERNTADGQERISTSQKRSPPNEESAPSADPSQCRHCATEPAVMPHATWPINLIQIIREIASSKSSKPKAPEFNFHLTKEAAENNAKVLEKYKNDLEWAIRAQARSPVGYGSEF